MKQVYKNSICISHKFLYNAETRSHAPETATEQPKTSAENSAKKIQKNAQQISQNIPNKQAEKAIAEEFHIPPNIVDQLSQYTEAPTSEIQEELKNTTYIKSSSAPQNTITHPTQTPLHKPSNVKSAEPLPYDIKDPTNPNYQSPKTQQAPHQNTENNTEKPKDTPQIKKIKKRIWNIRSTLGLVDQLGDSAPYSEEEVQQLEEELKTLEAKLKNYKENPQNALKKTQQSPSKNINQQEKQRLQEAIKSRREILKNTTNQELSNKIQQEIQTLQARINGKTAPPKQKTKAPINYQAEIKKRQDIAAKNPALKPQMEKEIQTLQARISGKPVEKEKNESPTEIEEKAKKEAQETIEKNRELIQENPEIAKTLDLSDTADDLENPQNLWELIAKLLKDLLEAVDGKTKLERIKEDSNKFIEELPGGIIDSNEDFNAVLKKLKEKYPNLSDEQLERNLESFSSEENHTEEARMQRRQAREQKHNSGELKYKGENIGESEEYPGGYEQAAKDLRANGIEIGSSGADKKGIIEDGSSSHKTRTCLKGIRNISIQGAIQLQKELKSLGGSSLMIRGGTENKHSTKYQYSHQRGYKFDFRDNTESKNLFNSIAKEQGKVIKYNVMSGTNLTLKNGQKIKVIYHGPDRHYDVTFYPSGEKSDQTESTTPVKDTEGTPVKTADGNLVTENQTTTENNSPQESSETNPTNSYEKFTKDKDAIKPISKNAELVRNMINQLEKQKVPYSFYAPVLQRWAPGNTADNPISDFIAGEAQFNTEVTTQKIDETLQEKIKKEKAEIRKKSHENILLPWNEFLKTPQRNLKNPTAQFQKYPDLFRKHNKSDRINKLLKNPHKNPAVSKVVAFLKSPDITSTDSHLKHKYLSAATLYKESGINPKNTGEFNHIEAMTVHLFKGNPQKDRAKSLADTIASHYKAGRSTEEMIQYGRDYPSNAIGAVGMSQFMGENIALYGKKILPDGSPTNKIEIKDLYEANGALNSTDNFYQQKGLTENIDWDQLKSLEDFAQDWIAFDSRQGNVGITKLPGKNKPTSTIEVNGKTETVSLLFSDYARKNLPKHTKLINYLETISDSILSYNQDSDDLIYTTLLAKQAKEVMEGQIS